MKRILFFFFLVAFIGNFSFAQTYETWHYPGHLHANTFELQDSLVWVGLNTGIEKRDLNGNLLETYTTADGIGESDRIQDITRLDNGVIFIETSTNYAFYDGSKWEAFNFPAENRNAHDRLHLDTAQNLSTIYNDTVWAYVEGGWQFETFDLENFEIITYGENAERIMNDNEENNALVSSIFRNLLAIDRNNVYWGSFSCCMGVYEVNWMIDLEEKRLEIADRWFTSMSVDSKNQKRAYTNGYVIYFDDLNTITDTVDIDNNPAALYIDKTIWRDSSVSGTEYRLVSYDGDEWMDHPLSFTQRADSDTTYQGLPELGNLATVKVDKDDNLWIRYASSSRGNLFKVTDGNCMEIKHAADYSCYQENLMDVYSGRSSAIYVHADANGKIWLRNNNVLYPINNNCSETVEFPGPSGKVFVTNTAGEIRYRSDSTFYFYNQTDWQEVGAISPNTHSLLVDGDDKTWGIYTEIAFLRSESLGRGGSRHFYQHNNYLAEYTDNSWNVLKDLDTTALHVFTGLDDQVWMASGAKLRQKTENSWISYDYPEEILDNNQWISSIHMNKNGDIWGLINQRGFRHNEVRYNSYLKTENNSGIYKFDGNSWTYFDCPEEITDLYTNKQTSGIWGYSRFNGVFYSPDGQSWTRFSEEDGLLNNNINSIAIDKAGDLWCGHPNGITKISLEGSVLQTFSRSMQRREAYIYPNPATDILHIKDKESSGAEIHTLNGKLIHAVDNASEINISHLNSGVYVLKFRRDGQVITRQFVKY